MKKKMYEGLERSNQRCDGVSSLFWSNRNRRIHDGDGRGETFIVILLTGDRKAPAAGNDKATLIRRSY